MSEAATTAESGPLSIEQAVEAMNPPPPEEQEAPALAAEDPPSEAEPTAEEDLDPETPAIEDEQGDEPESDPETPAIAAPKSWDAAERAMFAQLPPAAQQVIAAREAERDKAVSRSQQEASEAKQRADQEIAGVVQMKDQIGQVLQQASVTFADRWGHMDAAAWTAWASQDPEAAMIGKFQFDQEQAEFAQIAQTQAAAEQVAFQNYVKAESAKLPDLCPDLVDVKEGPARQSAVGKFLLDLGYQPEQLHQIGALDMTIAYKAMRWDQAQAKPAASTVKEPAPAARTPLKATAPAPQRTSQQRSAEQIRNRLTQTGSVDDAVALLQAMRG